MRYDLRMADKMNFDGLVSLIREERCLGEADVPGFDTKNGNENAKYLFLMEAPGPKAKTSGKISFENEDDTARNLKEQLEEAGIDRGDIALWNVVPWFIGKKDEKSIRAATGEDVKSGWKYLEQLVCAMPKLKCIFLVGGAARRAHLDLSGITTARIVCCHHPSGRVMNLNPAAKEENVRIFQFVKKTT
jgi:uracil-DNA glycosylase